MNENAIYAACAAVAAISFAVLCIYLIRTLVSAKKTLESLQTTLTEAGGTVEAIRGKVQELTENVNEISINVKEKLHAADALFRAAKDAGESLQETTHAAKEITGTISKAVKEQAKEPERPWLSWFKVGLKVATAVRQTLQANGDERQAARPGRPTRSSV